MNRIRAIWRAIFYPEPPWRFDGAYTSLRMMTGQTWEQALAERAESNRQRVEAWVRGEKVWP